jgi:hypothetical protein
MGDLVHGLVIVKLERQETQLDPRRTPEILRSPRQAQDDNKGVERVHVNMRHLLHRLYLPPISV